MINNPLKNTRIEFHILQSFPVTCLNRDDVGAPKTAQVGGSTRARVSSQAWKRQVRLEMNELGVTHGSRTKLIAKLIADACVAKGATDEQAKACGDKFEQVFIKKKEEKKPKKAKDTQENDAAETETDSSNDKSDTLLFLSPNEVDILADAFSAKGFNPDEVITQKDAKKQAKEVAGLLGNVSQTIDALDIALFGRMVAQAAELNIEAAASFAHAISTHRVSNEVEFFTALDDLQTDPGAAHMGSLEFNSATYYRYISLDLGQLHQTLAGQNLPEAVEAFTKALFVAVPAARQTTHVYFLATVIGYVVDRAVFKTERGYGPAYYITQIAAQLALGVLASILVMWFSRRREFRADAGGARLAGTHKMIAALQALQRAHDAPALPGELAAFGITGGGFSRLFMSHPPLEERIAALRNGQ